MNLMFLEAKYMEKNKYEQVYKKSSVGYSPYYIRNKLRKL